MATKNATKTRKQVTDAVDSVFDTARTPFLAVLGAGDLASQTVLDVLNKAKAQVDRSTSTPGTPADLRTLRARLDEVELRKLIDPNELRKLVDPSELRNVLDAYSKAANDLYRYLAEHGEVALDKLREQPQVANVLSSLEDAIESAQHRVGDVAGDATEVADDLLAKVTFRTRSAGEKAARATERATKDAVKATGALTEDAVAKTRETGASVSADVAELGEDVAHETRSATRRAANRTAPRKPAATKSSNTRKNGTSKAAEK